MSQIKSRILRLLASLGAGVVLAGSVGVAGASFDRNNNRGDNGHHETGSSIKNETDVDVDNTTEQNATSGDAVVVAPKDAKPMQPKDSRCHDRCHDEGNNNAPVVLGDATTGDASNESTSHIGVTVDNSGSCGCLQSGSEHHGSTSVVNDTDVDVNNTTVQNATSGDATVMGGSGGSAATGNASNSSSSTVMVSVSN